MSKLPQLTPPPQAVLLDLLLGMIKTQAIHEAVHLNLAEYLKDGPKSVEHLAEETRTHPAALRRLLRTLESLGIFAEISERVYEQTTLSHFLRPGIPGSLYDVAFIHGQPWQWRPWEQFGSALETGQSPFPTVFGTDLFAYFADNPVEGDAFNRAMAGFSNQVNAPIAQAYDCSSLSTLVDIGGGFGSLLTTIIRKNPQLRGILFELPSVIEATQLQVSSWDVADRCQLVAGDMFHPEDIPHADGYILKQIIKDWDDDAAVRILSNCRQALHSEGRILVAEQVLLPGQTMIPAKLIDLQLMVVLTGQERNADEYAALFEAAGLELVHIWPTTSAYSILEGRAK